MIIRYCDICGQEIDYLPRSITFMGSGIDILGGEKDVCRDCAELLKDIMRDSTPYKDLFSERMHKNKV